MTDVATGWEIHVGHTEEGAVLLQILDKESEILAQAVMNPIVAAGLIDQLFIATEAAARAVTAPKGSC